MVESFAFDPDHDRYPVASHLILQAGDGNILLMRRTGSMYGNGLFALPAGHVDMGETPIAGIVRETREEIGLTIDESRLIPASVMFRLSLEPRIDFFFMLTHWEGIPVICEPDRCTELRWAAPDDLPPDTLSYVGHALDGIKRGLFYLEYGWRNREVTD